MSTLPPIGAATGSAGTSVPNAESNFVTWKRDYKGCMVTVFGSQNSGWNVQIDKREPIILGCTRPRAILVRSRLAVGADPGLSVILAYPPVWHAGFIWDDDDHLTANPCIIGPLGLKEIWTTSAADICPFVLTTFWVEHALWGLKPLPYHLVNVLMHGGLRGVALAGAAEFARARRVAGCGALGPASGGGGIGGVDHRDEEHGIGFVLPAIDPFLCEMAKSKGPRRTNRRWLELCANLAFRWSGDGQQVFHGDSAGCSLLVRLVDGGPVVLAQRGKWSPSF